MQFGNTICKHENLQRSGSSKRGLIRLWQCSDCTATFRDKKPLVTLEDLDQGWVAKEDELTRDDLHRMGISYS